MRPGSATRPSRPCSATSSANASRSGPAPQMRSRQPGASRATVANAAISRSKPFWLVSRPAASTVGRSSVATGPPASGTALGMRITGGAAGSAAR